MGSLGSKPPCASPQCDTNFGRVCPRVWRSSGRGLLGTNPSRTCPCSPLPTAGSSQPVPEASSGPLARLVCCKALAPSSTSPAASLKVPQGGQVLPCTGTLPPWALVQSLQRTGTGWGAEERILYPTFPSSASPFLPEPWESPHGGTCWQWIFQHWLWKLHGLCTAAQRERKGSCLQALALGWVLSLAFALKSWDFAVGTVGRGIRAFARLLM